MISIKIFYIKLSLLKSFSNILYNYRIDLPRSAQDHPSYEHRGNVHHDRRHRVRYRLRLHQDEELR